MLNKLINGDFNEDEWLHMLREAWRNRLWNRVSKERSHHYAGAHAVDRSRTMKWYNGTINCKEWQTNHWTMRMI